MDQYCFAFWCLSSSVVCRRCLSSSVTLPAGRPASGLAGSRAADTPRRASRVTSRYGDPLFSTKPCCALDGCHWTVLTFLCVKKLIFVYWRWNLMSCEVFLFRFNFVCLWQLPVYSAPFLSRSLMITVAELGIEWNVVYEHILLSVICQNKVQQVFTSGSRLV